MRALLSTLLLSAAMNASAHPLDASHAPLEQLAHAFTAPHHALLLLAAVAIAIAGYRIASAQGAKTGEARSDKRR